MQRSTRLVRAARRSEGWSTCMKGIQHSNEGMGENEGKNRDPANFQLSRLLIFRVCQKPALQITAVPCCKLRHLADGKAETLPTSPLPPPTRLPLPSPRCRRAPVCISLRQDAQTCPKGDDVKGNGAMPQHLMAETVLVGKKQLGQSLLYSVVEREQKAETSVQRERGRR